MLRSILVVAFACAAVLSCRAVALAAAESCPAEISWDLYPQAASLGQPATSYTYVLSALSTRSVDATIIADTDKGWFAWGVRAVPLTKRTNTLANGQKAGYVASDLLGTNFPSSVVVRHAWVARAKTQGESFFGWDSQGAYDCDVTPFTTSSESAPFIPAPWSANAHPTPIPSPSPYPAPQGSAAKAVPTSAPFPAPSCDKPFVAAEPTEAVSPYVPMGVELTKPVTSDVMVQIAPDGSLVDAWTYESSGIGLIDEAAVDAARRSKYRNAISYCRPVSATYIFRADFRPD